MAGNSQRRGAVRKDGSVTKLHKHDDLSGEDVLPGFSCKIAELFPVM